MVNYIKNKVLNLIHYWIALLGEEADIARLICKRGNCSKIRTEFNVSYKDGEFSYNSNIVELHVNSLPSECFSLPELKYLELKM